MYQKLQYILVILTDCNVWAYFKLSHMYTLDLRYNFYFMKTGDLEAGRRTEHVYMLDQSVPVIYHI
jgi:hypothetical protein